MRRYAFEARSPSESAYLTALAAATDGVLLVNHAGRIVYANPSAESFFAGRSLLGQHVSELGDVGRRTICTIARELEGGVRRWRGPITARADMPDIDVTVELIGTQGHNDHHDRDVDEAGRLCVVLHGAATHAERSDAAAARDENKTKLSRFTSEIAHDFNNQIAVILNYTFVLLRHMPADSPLKAHVAEMQAAAWRASQVAQAIHRALASSTHILLPSSK